MVRLAAFASKTELRKPENRGSGLSSVERGAQPFRLRALSLAYAAFFLRSRRLAPTVFDANGPSR